METVKMLREQHKAIMEHLSRKELVIIELKQSLSSASNNTNGRGSIPPSVLANQMTQMVDNNTPRGEVSFDGAGGTVSGYGSNNRNDPFKTNLMRFMREMNERMDQNAVSRSDGSNFLHATNIRRPRFKKHTQLPFKPSPIPDLIPKNLRCQTYQNMMVLWISKSTSQPTPRP